MAVDPRQRPLARQKTRACLKRQRRHGCPDSPNRRHARHRRMRPKREARGFHGSRATNIPLPPNVPQPKKPGARIYRRTHTYAVCVTRARAHAHAYVVCNAAKRAHRPIAVSNGKAPSIPSPLLHNPNPSRHAPQSQSLSRSYGSILPTSLTYISLCG